MIGSVAVQLKVEVKSDQPGEIARAAFEQLVDVPDLDLVPGRDQQRAIAETDPRPRRSG